MSTYKPFGEVNSVELLRAIKDDRIHTLESKIKELEAQVAELEEDLSNWKGHGL